VEDAESRQRRTVEREALEPLPLKPEQVAVIRDAMGGVPKEGTSRAAFANAAYQSGGKTGTAQAIGLKAGEKYSQIKADERKRDHSLYIAAAPIDAPTVVLAVVVENAGFGSEAAAPIARRVFDFLLLGQYPSEEDLAATREGRSSAPMGAPRRAVDVPLPGATANAAGAPAARVGASGGGQGGGRPAGTKGSSDEARTARSKRRIDSTDPDERAQNAEYRRQLDLRRQQLGISPGRGRGG
jgi:penicillin-binding protein 2